jgi:hypothetical protein
LYFGGVGLGYTFWCDAFMFPSYVKILRSLEHAGPVLDLAALRGYVYDLRKLFLVNLEISPSDLLLGFNAVRDMCYLVNPQAAPEFYASIKRDILAWPAEAIKSCRGPLGDIASFDEADAKRGGDNLYQHFLRQWSVTFCDLCGLRRFNGIRLLYKRDE